MQATSRFHHIIGKMICATSQGVHQNVASNDATEVMLNLNALFKNFPISLLIGLTQFSVAGFLLQLEHRYSCRFIALKSSIFPKLAPVWKQIIFLIANGFVMLLTLEGVTQAHHLILTFIDQVIFDGEPLLLSAVILLSISFGLGAVDPTFRDTKMVCKRY